MLKNFNPTALGVSGRQSELIELALTYKFASMSVDLGELARKARTQGVDHATRFLRSAQIPVGDSPLQMELHSDDKSFETGVSHMELVAEVAKAAQCKRFSAVIRPFSPKLPYHEYFEFIRQRLGRLAELLEKNDLQLGLMLLAAPSRRKQPGSQPFIHKAEEILTLIKTVGSPHVGLSLDTWNWWVGGGALDQLRELPMQQLVSVRISGVPADVSPDEITEKQRCWPDDDKNILDVNAMVEYLRDSQFGGPVSMAAAGSSLSGRTREFLVQRASKALNYLISGTTPEEELPEAEETAEVAETDAEGGSESSPASVEASSEAVESESSAS